MILSVGTESRQGLRSMVIKIPNGTLSQIWGLAAIFIYLLFLSMSMPARQREGLTAKPRVVITADPELDDNNSIIRAILYSSDVDLEGLIYVSSQFHWRGDGIGTTQSIAGREYTRLGPLPVYIVALCPRRALYR